MPLTAMKYRSANFSAASSYEVFVDFSIKVSHSFLAFGVRTTVFPSASRPINISQTLAGTPSLYSARRAAFLLRLSKALVMSHEEAKMLVAHSCASSRPLITWSSEFSVPLPSRYAL